MPRPFFQVAYGNGRMCVEPPPTPPCCWLGPFSQKLSWRSECRWRVGNDRVPTFPYPSIQSLLLKYAAVRNHWEQPFHYLLCQSTWSLTVGFRLLPCFFLFVFPQARRQVWTQGAVCCQHGVRSMHSQDLPHQLVPFKAPTSRTCLRKPMRQENGMTLPEASMW